MENIYLPQKLIISEIEEQSPTVKLFRLKKEKGDFELNDKGMAYIPGQFVLIGQVGYGEAPFGLLSSPYQNKYLEVAVRKTGGVVTTYLHSLKPGDAINMRGPYGNGFPLEFFEVKDIILATGGCGIPPIASLIEHIIHDRDRFGDIYLIYGSKNPEEILLKERMEEWKKKDVNVDVTIDKPFLGWTGNVGFVADLAKKIKINPNRTAVMMCGPGPMVDSLLKVFLPAGISPKDIFNSEERRMQCGVGKCQHCTIGSKYVCMHGPVFSYDQIQKNHD